MKLVGSFMQFAQRVMGAVKKGRLPGMDSKRLEHLLTRTGKRNLILAKGLLSALYAGGASRTDIENLAGILEKASQRIADEKQPFGNTEKKELEAIFSRAYLSKKTAHRFAAHIDELLADEIDEVIRGRKSIVIPTKTEEKNLGIPVKKTIDVENRKNKIS